MTDANAPTDMSTFIYPPAAGAAGSVLQGSGLILPSEVDKQSFSCAHCGATQVTGVGPRAGARGKGDSPDKNRKMRPARPRSAVVDGQKVLLCNACGIYWQRKGQKRPLKPGRRNNAKKKAKTGSNREDTLFYQIVSELYPPADADFLFCDCTGTCTIKYLMPDPNDRNSFNQEECNALLGIHKKALALKKLKGEKTDGPGGMSMMQNDGSDDERAFRGYGRGHASSKQYETFVFQHIEWARARKLCGKFRKKLLSFSNDWLYKRPTIKTVITTGPNDEKIATKIEGKPRVLQEKKFEFTPQELRQATCCHKACCQKIWTNQIAKWRNEYVDGTSEQRWNVIQQMLIGEGYGSSKCVNVVRMITGCSRNLVAQVSRYLQINQCMGRPPPQSGKDETGAPGQQSVPSSMILMDAPAGTSSSAAPGIAGMNMYQLNQLGLVNLNYPGMSIPGSILSLPQVAPLPPIQAGPNPLGQVVSTQTIKRT